MSSTEIMDEPLSKKARLGSPAGGLVTPRESTDFGDFDFEKTTSLNDQIPDDLFNDIDEPPQAPTGGGMTNGNMGQSNGSSAQLGNNQGESFGNCVSNGPTLSQPPFSSFSSAPDNNYNSQSLSSSAGVTVTSTPIVNSCIPSASTSSFVATNQHTSATSLPHQPNSMHQPMGSAPPPHMNGPQSSQSVLEGLLLNNPSSGMDGPPGRQPNSCVSASPGRPPAGPGPHHPPGSFRGPMGVLSSPPQPMAQRHPSGPNGRGFPMTPETVMSVAHSPSYPGNVVVSSSPHFPNSQGIMPPRMMGPNVMQGPRSTLMNGPNHGPPSGMVHGPPQGMQHPRPRGMMHPQMMNDGAGMQMQPRMRMPMASMNSQIPMSSNGQYSSDPMMVVPNGPPNGPPVQGGHPAGRGPPEYMQAAGPPGGSMMSPSYNPRPPFNSPNMNPNMPIVSCSGSMGTNGNGVVGNEPPMGMGGGGGGMQSNGPPFPGSLPPNFARQTSSNGPPSNGSQGGTPGQQDPEKRKLIQQQLVLLLHAHKCQQREKDAPNGQRTECQLPHCSTMKGVLSHMTSCTNGRVCNYAHCASSRQIIQHWKNCHRTDCPVCLPLKNITSDKAGRAAEAGVMSLINGSRPPYPGNEGAVPGIGGPIAPPNTVIGPQKGGINILNQPSLPRPPSSGQFANNLPPPEQTAVTKSWHQEVTPDLRNHLVGKLVKAIFPSPDPSAIHDQRIKDLIQYARKVEKEMFEVANDREEYYHLLAEKIYKIQKELQDKKAKREGMQRTMQGQPNSNAPGLVPPNLRELDMSAPPNRTAPSDQRGGSVGGPPGGMNPVSTASVLGLKAEFLDIKPDLQKIRADVESGASGFGVAVKTEIREGKGSDVKPSVGGAGKDVKPNILSPRQKTSDVQVAEKKFPPDQIRAALLPVWERLEKMEEAIPFRVPVDPELLNIPDYFEIIKKPMDMSTMKEKLNQGEYSHPWQFCDDMWLMFDNAWIYNRKNSKVYKYCTKISECFMEDIDPVMRKLGYCCGGRKAFTPLALFCYGQPMCTIARDQPYYCYETSSSQYGVTVSEKYTYCIKCFENLPESINLSEDPSSSTNMVPQSDFKLLKNDQIEFEPFVNCTKCGRRWHKICAPYNEKVIPGGFVCENCSAEHNKPRPENRFTAKRLPHCKLSRHIEGRVNNYLRGKMAGAGDVIIRVLAVSDKEVEVKPHMKSKYVENREIPERFPYRTKAIFAFEVIDGVEVCFFGLHVQEYGTNSSPPNQRRVYIAYLDSVHFFTPRDERTNVYHEILLGYLEYCKSLNYSLAHIWACPPSEGDDYIFHCHPAEQKIPKPKRLQEWYKKMLDKGIIQRIVTDYKDVYKQALEDNIQSIAELPYFEGDFWPNVYEDCLKEVEKEEDERRRQEEAMQAAEGIDDMEDVDFELSGKGKKKSQKGSKKKQLNKKGQQKKSKNPKGSGNDLMDKVLTQMEKHKEVFFVIRLHTTQTAATLGPVEDPDPLMPSELMDGRDTFLSRARDEHWEFSCLRRAKYSTMCLTHALHTQGKEPVVFTCNSCKNTNANMWHCSTCDDFDLCQSCYEKSNHEHRMEKINSLVDQGDSDQSKQDQNSRNESIQRCIQSLVHACQCRDANCRRLSCHKMKRVVQHTKMCKKRQSGHCPVCKQLIALCCYHAKHCVDPACQVPFCMNIRQKLQEQKQAQRRHQDRMMMRRMQGMFQGVGPGTPANPGGPVNPLAQNPAAAAALPYPHPHPSPAPLQPPPNAIQAAQDAQRLASLQRHPGGMRPQAPQQAYGGRGMGPIVSMPGGPGGVPMNPAMMQQPRHRAPPPNAQSQMAWRPDQMHTFPGGGQPPQMGPRSVSMPHHMGQQQPGNVPQMRSPAVDERIQNERIQNVLSRLRTAKGQEEHDQLINEMKKDPKLLTEFIAAKQNAQNKQQQPPQQQQQSQQQPWPQQQRQMSGPPQFYQQGMQRMPRPQGYGPGQGGERPQFPQGGQFPRMMNYGGVRQPNSPMGQSILNQVRSPPGTGGVGALARSPQSGMGSPGMMMGSMQDAQMNPPSEQSSGGFR